MFRIALRFLGPALLGLGTIFQPKAKMTDHWSTSPQTSIQVEASIDESGDASGQDGDRRERPEPSIH